MSHENVKIVGNLRNRFRDLLGGQKPTPKRVETLLDELEQARAVMGVTIGAPVPKTERPNEPEDPDDDTEDTPENPPRAEEFEDLVDDPAERQRLPEPSDPRDAVIELLKTQNKMLVGELKNLGQKIDEMKRPATAEEKAEALRSGQLPPSVTAPPLGFSGEGPNKWPIGEWFPSPIGPRVWMKICPDCGQGVQHHWYCCVCKGGPFHYATPCKTHNDPMRHPFYTKNHFPPGQVWGVGHAVCSKPCMDDYLGRMGVVAGVNEVEGARMPTTTAEPVSNPDRPVTALGSD